MMPHASDFSAIVLVALLLVRGGGADITFRPSENRGEPGVPDAAPGPGAPIEGDFNGDASAIMLRLAKQSSKSTPSSVTPDPVHSSGAMDYERVVAMSAFNNRADQTSGEESPSFVETPVEPPQPTPVKSPSKGEETIVPVEVETPVQISDRVMSSEGLDIPCDSDRIKTMPRAVLEKCHKETNDRSTGKSKSEADTDSVAEDASDEPTAG